MTEQLLFILVFMHLSTRFHCALLLVWACFWRCLFPNMFRFYLDRVYDFLLWSLLVVEHVLVLDLAFTQ